MTEPNDRQCELIGAHEGIYLVDAGAGTGKTFTITRRYADILDTQAIDPDDLLLLTYTTAAADEMTDRIIDHCDRDYAELHDAPIGTFHSRCYELLRRHGIEVPRHLGLDDDITHTTTVVEDQGVERLLFDEFFEQFTDDHPAHTEIVQVLRDSGTVLGLIRELAAKGIVPTADGWYRTSEAALRGELGAFMTLFDAANEPNEGATGPTQSDLREDLGSYGGEHTHTADAPTKRDIRGDRGTKQIDEQWAKRAFEEDRSALLAFVHDVYVEYLRYALGRNYLTFGMLQLFAFVLLCEDHALRESIGYEYVMIDEFQDTSEIQFKLALLLMGETNLCVVGDWKQSIYSFQYAEVENITSFERRLERFTADLNADHPRIDLGDPQPKRIELTTNYRSPQAIIDFAEQALTTPATGSETIDDPAAIREDIVHLEAEKSDEEGRIEAVTAEDEIEGVLTAIQRIVGNEAYAVGEEGRAPKYDDIAVLSRTHSFGRDLLGAAEEIGLPVAYDGDIQLFDTDEAKLVLAWLRILEYDSDRGWAVVLERAGIPFDTIEALLDAEDYPAELVAFKDELASFSRVDAIARAILERYGFVGETADAVITTVRSMRSVTDFTHGDVIRYLERGIDQGWTRSVDAADRADAITIQTIHSVKGLEHPIVILANMNRHAFPGSGGRGGRIRYEEQVGVRQTTVVDAIDGRPHRFRNWHWDVINAALPSDYDEERRLLYVALSRAEDHLLLSAGETPNRFFEELAEEPEVIEPDLTPVAHRPTEQSQINLDVPTESGPVGLSAHDLIDEGVFEEVEGGRGTARGQAVHDFAEAYVTEGTAEASKADEQHVAAYIDGLDGRLDAEVPIHLPMSIDERRVTIAGYIDLLCVTDDGVRVIDYKTDGSAHALDQYRKQLSVYYHVVNRYFEDREVEATVYFTKFDEPEPIDPLSWDELTDKVGESIASRR